MSGPEADILVGNALPLKNIPAGTVVHNIELRPGKGGADGALGRRAGAVGFERRRHRAAEAASGEIRRVPVECMATVGQVGNVEHENVSLGKAGRKRWLGKTPAQPRRIDEPGRSPARRRRRQDFGRPSPGDPWGQPTRGFKTRNNKRTDKWIVTRKAKKR